MSAQEDGSMSLIEHLTELRTRLIWCVVAFFIGFFVLFPFSKEILLFIFEPIRETMLRYDLDPTLQITAAIELLFSRIRISMLGGMLVVLPVILYQVWAFVSPGLYKNERNAALPFLVASPVMFLLGASFAQFFITPLAMNFLIGLSDVDPRAATGGDDLRIVFQGKVNENLNFSIQLISAFGLCFQLPVALTLLGKVGLVSSQGLVNARKYAVVLILILAALVTPPDVITQIILFAVVYGLYELSIWLVRWVETSVDEEEIDDGETETNESA